jgi:hypothetical protein
MSESDPNLRRTGLMFLPNLAANLRGVFIDAGIEESEWVNVCAESVSARCTICEEDYSGEEFAGWLMTLGDSQRVGRKAMRFIRLERGCCGNSGCNATFCEIRLEPHPSLDWSALAIGALSDGDNREAESVNVVATAGRDLVKKQMNGRTVVAVIALMVIWVFHQWYNGGTIPLLRNEKTFSGEPSSFEANAAENVP